MKIAELKAGQGNIIIQATIKGLDEIRIINKYGRELKLRNAVLEDDSGTIKLTLWNQDVDRFKAGDLVELNNGYVNEFQGEKQLTTGKFGKIELAGKDVSGEVGVVDSGEESEPVESNESEVSDY